jgi:hypothetical protein
MTGPKTHEVTEESVKFSIQEVNGFCSLGFEESQVEHVG